MATSSRSRPTIWGLTFPSSLAIVGLAAVWLAAAPAHTPQFRARTRTVAVYATVQDRSGALVPDLARDQFQILDDGKPVEITTFSSEVVPVTAVLLLDMSHSMAPRYDSVRDAALHLVDELLPADRFRIGSFGREVAVSPRLTNDRQILRRVIDEELWPGGSTPIWRAAVAGMDSLAGEPGRRVILLVTDGVSRDDANCAPASTSAAGPCTSPRDVNRQAQAGEFLIYGVGFSALDPDVKNLAEDSGGGYVAIKGDANLKEAFRRVLDELHHQYVLGFTPAALDGRTHKLEVRLTRPGLTARARKSYLADEASTAAPGAAAVPTGLPAAAVSTSPETSRAVTAGGSGAARASSVGATGSSSAGAGQTGAAAGASIVRVLVDDAQGSPRKGLVTEDFQAIVDGAAQRIASVRPVGEALTMAILVDVTASLHRCPAGVAGFPSTGLSGGLGTSTRTVQPTGRIPPAVPLFALNGLRRGDRVLTSAISRRPVMSDDFESDPSAIRRRWRTLFDLPPVESLGPSPIWDRVSAAVSRLANEPGPAEIVIVTDGHAGGNDLGVREVAEFAAHAGIAVNVVSEEIPLPLRPIGSSGRQQPDATAALQFLAEETGGLFVFDRMEPDPVERPDGSKCGILHPARAVEAVIDRLRSAYALEIAMSPAATSQKLEIRVRGSGGVVYARRAVGPGGR